MDEELNKIIEKSRQKIAVSNFKMEENMSKKRINKSIFSSIAVACFIVATITGTAFAKDISNFVRGLFGPNASEGVDIAIDNGYVTEANTEYQNSNGIEIKVESFLLDDYNLDINFVVKVADNYNIDEFERADFTDLVIKNENGDFIFNTGMDMQGKTEEQIKEMYCGKEPYMGGYSFHKEKINDNEFKLVLTASGSSVPFPKSKCLVIDLTEIDTWAWVDENSVEEGKIEKNYTGNWHFEIDVPEEQSNREGITYKAISCSEKQIDLNSITASLSKTAFKISIPKIKTDKVNFDALHNYDNISIYHMIALQKEYVETSKGKKFKPAQRSDGDGGYGLPADEPETIIDYHQTFNLTEFDATDTVTVHIFTNKDEEIIIEFEKVIF